MRTAPLVDIRRIDIRTHDERLHEVGRFRALVAEKLPSCRIRYAF